MSANKINYLRQYNSKFLINDKQLVKIELSKEKVQGDHWN